MANTGGDASEAGRLLARARWGSRGVVRAVETVVGRRDELTAEQRAELLAAAGDQDGSGDE
jgi:hypothetical protein